jgi:hypothetical protein
MVLFVAVLAFPALVSAQGLAGSKVAVFGTATTGYGFSAYSGLWTSVPLDSPTEASMTSDFLGYLRTSTRAYAFNPTNNHWYSTAFAGEPKAQSVVGATAAVWTSDACYAISSSWAIWKSQAFTSNERPLGGSAAGSYAIVWTDINGYAFSSASGHWVPAGLASNPVGGLACSGFGLIWTNTTAYAFNPASQLWTAQDITASGGVSADASGNVGLIWSGSTAYIYSATADTWQTFNFVSNIWSGQARGDVAIIWDSYQVICYDANSDTYTTQPLPPPRDSEASVPVHTAGFGFSVDENPGVGSLSFRLPDDGKWKIDVVRVDGSLVRSFDAGPRAGSTQITWDGTDTQGYPVASGSYWVRAQSGAQAEARRVVLLH